MSFSCTQCGKCCRGNGNVYVNNAEIKAISNYLNISEDNFRSEYMSTPYTIRNHENFDYCKLFDGKENKCTVYPHRPTQVFYINIFIVIRENPVSILFRQINSTV